MDDSYLGARRSLTKNITSLTKYFPLGTTIVDPPFHPHVVFHAFKNPCKPHQKIKSEKEINIWTQNNCFYFISLFIFIFQLSCLFSVKIILKNKLEVLQNLESTFKKSKNQL